MSRIYPIWIFWQFKPVKFEFQAKAAWPNMRLPVMFKLGVNPAHPSGRRIGR